MTPLLCSTPLPSTDCLATFYQAPVTKINCVFLSNFLAFPFIYHNPYSSTHLTFLLRSLPGGLTNQLYLSMDWDSYFMTGPDPRYFTLPPPAQVEKSTPGQVLDHLHQQKFRRALLNVLSTSIAEQTLAQILDGLPLKDVAWDKRYHRHYFEEPVFHHTELCPDVLEKTINFRETFEPLTLNIPSRV